MRPLVTAVIAAIEAVAAAVVGFAMIAVPALLLWMATFALAAEPATVLAGIAASWSLAHFAPVTLSLTPETALSLGLAPAAFSFVVSLAPLGITLVSVLLAVRSGWRLGARGGVGAAGVLGAALGFGGAAAAIAGLAGPLVAGSLIGSAVIAGLVYAVPNGLAYVVRAARDEHPWWRSSVRAVQRGVEGLGLSGAAALPTRAADTLRLAAAAVAVVVGLAGIAVTAALTIGYGEVIALTQHLQLDPLGSTLLFVLQLALLPVVMVWGIAWLSGAGFAVGAGTSVTPFETLLGPLPALPIFGAIPQGWGGFGGLAPAVLVLAGVAVAFLLGRSSELRRAPWPIALAVPAVAAVIAGLVITGISALATGAIGPERLAETGPSPWLVGALVAAELGAGLLLGTAAIRVDAGRLRAAFPDQLPESMGWVRGPDAGATRSAASTRSAEGTEVAGDGSRSADAAEVGDSELADLTVPLDDVVDAAGHGPRAADQRDPDALVWPEESEDLEDLEALEALEALEDPGDPAHPGDAEDPEHPEGPDTTAGPADPVPEPDEGVSETEALRAYSWDDTAGTDDERPPERQGWRWPRPGR